MVRRLLIFTAIAALIVPLSDQKNNKKKKEKKVEKNNNERFKALINQGKTSSECTGLLAEELNTQCASYKVSPECFIQHYGSIGLEFGEEDTLKEKQFMECLKSSGLLLSN